jgi:folate-dependent phosphoribosylglycinamide formyltransferase PurN
MRLGVITSSGGSALATACECLKEAGHPIDIFLVADRECGALDWAQRGGHTYRRIPYARADSFSAASLAYLQDCAVDCVLLLYTRHIDAPLVGALPVYNIHPSLLPAFPGIRAVADAVRAGVRVIGATLHVADLGLDTGSIIGQIATALPVTTAPLARAAKVSFLQKVYLILLLYELVRWYGMTIDLNALSVSFTRTPVSGFGASPALSDEPRYA